MSKTLYLRATLPILLGAAFLNPPLFANNQRSNPSTATTNSKLPPCQLVFDKCVGKGTYTTTYRAVFGVTDRKVKYVFYGEWKKDRPHGFGWLDTFNNIESKRPDERTVGYFKKGEPYRAISYKYFSPLYAGEVKDIYIKGWTRRSYETVMRQPFKYDPSLFIASDIVNFPYVNPSDKELVNELDVVVVPIDTSEEWAQNHTICVKNSINADVLKVHSIVKSELEASLTFYERDVVSVISDKMKQLYKNNNILFYDNDVPPECAKTKNENGMDHNNRKVYYNIDLRSNINKNRLTTPEHRWRKEILYLPYERQKERFAKFVIKRSSYKAIAQPLNESVFTGTAAYQVLMGAANPQIDTNRLQPYTVCTTLPMNEFAAVAAEPRYRYSGFRILSEDQSTFPTDFQLHGQFFQNRLLSKTPQNVSYDWAVKYFTDAAADKQKCEVFFDTIQVTKALKDRLHTDGVVLKEGATFSGNALSGVFTTHLNNSGIDVSGFAEYDFRYRFSPDNWRKFSSYDIRTKQTYDVFLQEMTQAGYVGPANEETLLSYLSDKLAASKSAGLTATSIQQQRFALAEEQRAQARRAKEAEDLRRRLAREKSVRDQQARARKIAADQKQLAITHPRSIVIRCLIHGRKFNLLVCLDKTSVEIRANGRYYFGANHDLSAFNNFITDAYPFHAEIVMPVRGSFSLVAQNGSDSAILNVSVIDTASRRTLYEKSVARFGVVRF